MSYTTNPKFVDKVVCISPSLITLIIHFYPKTFGTSYISNEKSVDNITLWISTWLILSLHELRPTRPWAYLTLAKQKSTYKITLWISTKSKVTLGILTCKTLGMPKAIIDKSFNKRVDAFQQSQEDCFTDFDP